MNREDLIVVNKNDDLVLVDLDSLKYAGPYTETIRTERVPTPEEVRLRINPPIDMAEGPPPRAPEELAFSDDEEETEEDDSPDDDDGLFDGLDDDE